MSARRSARAASTCGATTPSSSTCSTTRRRSRRYQTGDAVDPHPPHDEEVAYDDKIDGSPPIVTLTRTDSELNDKRPQGLLDPATDPLLAAGSGKDVPLVLK